MLVSTINIKAFFDEATFTVTYVVNDIKTKHCAIFDSVLDFDQPSGRTSSTSADNLIEYIKQNSLITQWIFESHVHADHLSAAPYLQEKLGGKTAISEHVTDVQTVFKGVFNEGNKFKTDGSQFNIMIKEGDVLALGDSEINIMHTPGHTPACLSFIIGDAVFVGDTMFMPDFGTARTDFPGGDAETLFNSIQKILALPDHFRIFTCHDYKAPGRDFFAWESTVLQQKENNLHVKNGTSLAAFIEFRTTRDAQLSLPKLILPSVQVNMRAGNMPEPEENGVSYLKLPLNAL